MTNCYATGDVNGNDYVGGVAGHVGSGEMTNCAALNQSISGTSDVGRVVGAVTGSPTLSGNAAFIDMTVTVGGSGKTLDRGNNKLDGEDITKAAIRSEGTIGGRFTTANGWTVQPGKLPGLLGAVVDLPDYLK